MIIEQIKGKTPIKKRTLDSWWWCEASINPYLGCYHDCIYCDGKAESYYMHEDYSTRIKGKINAPHLFEQFFKKIGFVSIKNDGGTLIDFFPKSENVIISKQPGKFICGIGGGVCDVYQPAEKKLKITQRLVKIAHDYNVPIFILTKNKLVLRDLNLLKEINSSAYANIGLSITISDDDEQKNVEPNASTTTERFRVLRKIRDQGIHAGVLFLPVLPFIGDTKENLHTIFKKAKKAGAEYVLVGGLTLKPGRNKTEFLSQIERNYPNLYSKYSRLYSNDNKWGHPDNNIAKELGLINPTAVGFELGKEYGIPTRMPRYIPEGRIAANLKIATILFRIAFVVKHRPPFWQKTGDFYKAAYYLESLSKDIFDLSSTEINSLDVSKRVLPYIKQFLKTETCEYLEINEESHSLFY